MSSAAQLVMVTRPRPGSVECLDHGRVRQTFDVVNCAGLSVIWEGFKLDPEGEFETTSQTYHLTATGQVFDDADEALLAWDAAQNDHEIVDALGESLLRLRHGLMRPLWADRKPADKQYWIAMARSYRNLLRSVGLDLSIIDRSGE